MWNKRNDDIYPPQANRDPAPAPLPVQQFTGGGNVRPAGLSRNTAVIGEMMYVHGDIRSQEELYVAGQVDGNLESQNGLTVGPKGKVKANVKAHEVTIHGSVLGNVEVVEKIVIHKDGSLIGDIKAAGIVIDDGAYFKGSIDIIRPARKLEEAGNS